MNKQCSDCKQFLSLDSFPFDKSRNRHLSVCKSCTSLRTKNYQNQNPEKWKKYSKDSYNKISELIINWKSEGCLICGDKRHYVIDAHHMDPSTKSFSIGERIQSINKIKKELKKCVPICKNCHAELHYKNRNLNYNMKKQAVLSLSGGMDSSTLLLHLLAEDYEVLALSFDYGQKHRVELEKATDLVQYLKSKNLNVNHQIITLDGLSNLLNSALVEGGKDVPEGHYAEENMKATVVPNRNKIFSSIIQSAALSIADRKNTECVIALGVHSGDHTIYPDCTDDFRKIDEQAFKIGNWNSERVNYYVPYMEGNKFTILEDGEKCCEKLGLNFDEVYSRTNTSYKPIKLKVYYHLDNGDQEEYEEWFSDYKSASSVERVEAFLKLGRKDPVSYADEFGPVTWNQVVEHVQNILDSHATS